MRKFNKINEAEVQGSEVQTGDKKSTGGLVNINQGPKEVLAVITDFKEPAPGGAKSENIVKPEIQKILAAGTTDTAGSKDEVTKVITTNAKCGDMFPTQMQIGTGASLDDQILSKFGNLDAALAGLKAPTKMNSDGGSSPVLCFKGGDGRIWILDGHHRWSQAYATSPECQMVIALLQAPGVTEPKAALALCHEIIAVIYGKSPTKSFKGENLLTLSGDKVAEYIKNQWSKGDEEYQFEGSGGKRKISEGKAECLAKLKAAGLIKEGTEEEAIELYRKNCELLINKSKKALSDIEGGYSRNYMPQPGEAGDKTGMTTTPAKAAAGEINYLNPVKADVKDNVQVQAESRIIKTYEKFINLHKSSKTFDNYQPTNEGFGFGLALIAGVFGAIFAPSIYREAKNFWSKNVIGSRYKETGKVEKVLCEFDERNISPAVSSLTPTERETGKVEIPVKEYKDIFGNLCYGWDHTQAGQGEKPEMFTAMYRAEDLPILKEWLADGKRYEGKGRNLEIKPIDLIYVGDIRYVSTGGTPIGL